MRLPIPMRNLKPGMHFVLFMNLCMKQMEMLPFSEVYEYLAEQLCEDQIKILTLNSVVSYNDNTQYEEGINVIVGGNSLKLPGDISPAPNYLLLQSCKALKRTLCGSMHVCLDMIETQI